MSITFREVSERAKKATLIRHFTKEYFGECGKIDEAVLGPSSKFICAYDGPNELGFVRIVCYATGDIGQKDTAIWSASDGYVRKEYRSRGVLKSLISYVIQKYGVCLILIKSVTYKENRAYYESLGFSYVMRHESDEELVRVSLKEFSHIIDRVASFERPKKLMTMGTSGSINALMNRSLGP
jgi:hypothetical protein